MKLRLTIKSVEQRDNEWHVHGTGPDNQDTTLRTRKLVVASGMTSEPHWPKLANRDLFTGTVVHQEGFGASPVVSSDKIQNVVVLGGAKSAADMVYACVKAGKTVTWLIRDSGAGPAPLISSEGRGAYRNHPEYASTRIMGSLSPSPWATENTRTRFMGRTVIGRSLMVSPWANVDKAVHSVFDNAAELNARDDFKKLRPTGR